MVSNQVEVAFRHVMRHVPCPVTVVTFAGVDGPRGVTIGSFTSVSLDPPLVSFNVMLESTAHDMLVDANHFCIHILERDQVPLGERFALPDLTSSAQFNTVAHSVDDWGIPRLDDVLATVFCRRFEAVPAGDHTLLLGEVLSAETLRGGQPMVYYKSSYREVGGELASSEPADTP